MSRFAKRCIRLAAFASVAALIVAALAPVVPGDSPYLSALSTLAASSVYAAKPTCNNRACTATAPYTCTHQKGSNCVSSGSRCSSDVCI